jgi:hypothetical protein
MACGPDDLWDAQYNLGFLCTLRSRDPPGIDIDGLPSVGTIGGSARLLGLSGNTDVYMMLLFLMLT